MCTGIFTEICTLFVQRDRKERKLYSDDWALGDDEIEGRRSFSLQDKLESDRFSQCFAKEMQGPGILISFYVFQYNHYLLLLLAQMDVSCNRKIYLNSKIKVHVSKITHNSKSY